MRKPLARLVGEGRADGFRADLAGARAYYEEALHASSVPAGLLTVKGPSIAGKWLEPAAVRQPLFRNCAWVGGQPQTAPSDAEPTSRTYFASTPVR